MGYIKELRKFIGHRPIIMPSACVILMNDKNEMPQRMKWHRLLG